jgi:hypothetical protein
MFCGVRGGEFAIAGFASLLDGGEVGITDQATHRRLGFIVEGGRDFFDAGIVSADRPIVVA